MLPLLTPEEELRLHDRAMSASSCGITIADCRLPDMPLIYVNDAFESVTGYTVQETMGRNCRFLQIRSDGTVDSDQPGLQQIRRALRAGEDCTATLRNYRKDGELFYNELHVSPIFDAAGNLTHFVGVQTDITRRVLAEELVIQERADLEKTLSELRETQAMLVHIEKMSALGQMVAGVAHEINNPISFVTSNLHSLRAAMNDFFNAYDQLEALLAAQGVSLRAAAADIRAAADIDFLRSDLNDLFSASLSGLDRVKRIVQALRTFSRLDEAEIKETSLRENIESTLALARAELRDRIEVIIDIEPMPDIRCHPAELNQVFLNIILNAAQAIEGRGRITIRGRDMGDHVRLEFEDTGKGMTPDIMRQIFNPFFTTKPVGQGTGLGLSIAYKIITDRHKGTISVESTPNVGSTFIITLPKDVKP
jgi:PAS domain S-box-containing protein